MTAQGGHDGRIGMVAARLEHLERIESYGIARVELVILPREEERAVRRFVARAAPGLSVHCPLFRDCDLDGYPLLAALFDTDAERQKASVELMERELSQAADWGAGHMVAHLQRAVGILGEAVPAGWDERRALDCALRAGERLAEAARRVGVPVHLENMMGQPLFARPETYWAFLEGLPPEWVSLCLDVGHAALDAAAYGFDLREFVAHIAPRIGSLHVYNNQVAPEFDFATLRDEGRLRKFPPHPAQSVEQGWIDVAGVLDIVLGCRADAQVTLEVYWALDTDRERFLAGLEWVEGVCLRRRGGGGR